MCAKNTAPVAVAFSRPFRSLRSGIVLLFNSARKPLRMNRWCIKIRGGIAKDFRNGSPLSKPSGEEYGQVLSFSTYYHEESKKQFVKVACVSDGRSQVCLLQAKLFNRCTTMQEVVSSFVIGHWAASRVVEGNSHVSYSSPPPNIVEVEGIGIGEEYPVTFYTNLVQWFSKEGDTVTEVGTGHRIGNAFVAAVEGGRHALLVSTGTQDRTKLLQNLTTVLCQEESP